MTSQKEDDGIDIFAEVTAEDLDARESRAEIARLESALVSLNAFLSAPPLARQEMGLRALNDLRNSTYGRTEQGCWRIAALRRFLGER